YVHCLLSHIFSSITIRTPPTSTLFPYTTLFRSVTSDPSSSEIDRERRRRRDEEQLRARESRPHHIVTAHELDQETEDGVGEEVDPEQIAGHAHVRAAPPPQPAEHRALERALVKERRMTRHAIEA